MTVQVARTDKTDSEQFLEYLTIKKFLTKKVLDVAKKFCKDKSNEKILPFVEFRKRVFELAKTNKYVRRHLENLYKVKLTEHSYDQPTVGQAKPTHVQFPRSTKSVRKQIGARYVAGVSVGQPLRTLQLVKSSTQKGGE